MMYENLYNWGMDEWVREPLIDEIYQKLVADNNNEPVLSVSVPMQFDILTTHLNRKLRSVSRHFFGITDMEKMEEQRDLIIGIVSLISALAWHKQQGTWIGITVNEVESPVEEVTEHDYQDA